MAGPARIITLGSSFSGSGQVKLQKDPIIVPTGTLALIEPAHPANPDISALSGSALTTALAAVPADADTIGNVAHDVAAAFMGVADDVNLKSVYRRVTANIPTSGGTLGRAERSLKGGLHVIMTQSAYSSGLAYQVVDLPPAVMTYLAAHPTHVYYLSQWGQVTRAALSPADSGLDGGMQIYKNAGSGTLGGLAMFGNTDANVYPQPADGTHRFGATESGLNVVGPRYVSVAALPSQAIVAGDFAAEGDKAIMSWGKTAGTTGSGSVTYNNKWQSRIIYRFLMEDLTASARTGLGPAADYALVNAIDNALFQRHVNTAGGRYFGDTFTAPSAIA